jgi:hypothetical protein
MSYDSILGHEISTFLKENNWIGWIEWFNSLVAYPILTKYNLTVNLY